MLNCECNKCEIKLKTEQILGALIQVRLSAFLPSEHDIFTNIVSHLEKYNILNDE